MFAEASLKIAVEHPETRRSSVEPHLGALGNSAADLSCVDAVALGDCPHVALAGALQVPEQRWWGGAVTRDYPAMVTHGASR